MEQAQYGDFGAVELEDGLEAAQALYEAIGSKRCLSWHSLPEDLHYGTPQECLCFIRTYSYSFFRFLLRDILQGVLGACCLTEDIGAKNISGESQYLKEFPVQQG